MGPLPSPANLTGPLCQTSGLRRIGVYSDFAGGIWLVESGAEPPWMTVLDAFGLVWRTSPRDPSRDWVLAGNFNGLERPEEVTVTLSIDGQTPVEVALCDRAWVATFPFKHNRCPVEAVWSREGAEIDRHVFRAPLDHHLASNDGRPTPYAYLEP